MQTRHSFISSSLDLDFGAHRLREVELVGLTFENFDFGVDRVDLLWLTFGNFDFGVDTVELLWLTFENSDFGVDRPTELDLLWLTFGDFSFSPSIYVLFRLSSIEEEAESVALK